MADLLYITFGIIVVVSFVLAVGTMWMDGRSRKRRLNGDIKELKNYCIIPKKKRGKV